VTLEAQSIGPGGDSARVSLYTPAPGSGVWGSSSWDGSIWSAAGWQYVDCEVLEVTYRWGAGSEAGVLTKAEAGELDLALWDPDRLLDPLNPESQLWGAVRPGIPVRLEGVTSDDGRNLWPAAYGYIDEAEHDLATGTGRIRAVDGVSLLGLATFPPGNQPVANTLRARVRDVVSRAGMAGLVPCQPESDFAGIADPPVTPRDPDKGPEAVWPMILEAAEDALWYVWVDSTGLLRFRDMSSFPPPALGLGCPAGSSDFSYGRLEARWPFDDAGDLADKVDGYHLSGTGQLAYGSGALLLPGDGSNAYIADDGGIFHGWTDFTIWAEIEGRVDGSRRNIACKGNGSWGLMQGGDGRVGLIHSFREDLLWTPGPVVGRHTVAASITNTSTVRLFVDELEVARRDGAPPIGQTDWPLRIGTSEANAGAFEESWDRAIYEVRWYSGGYAPPVAVNWLTGLSDIVGRVASDRITNRVTAEDSAGAPLGPWEDAVSIELYGPRALEAARAVPSASSWADEILSDRADASYQLDVLEVRPYTRSELGMILQANTDGPRELRVRDDEHGPTIDLRTRYYGGELGVTSEGWRAVWVTGIVPGQLPTRREKR
jgi:hypothetical protein